MKKYPFNFVPSCVALAVFTVWSHQSVAQVVTLPAVVIKGENNPYTTNETNAGTRTETPVEQVPQSVIVVPRALIEDQQSATLSDALRNVSNVNAIDARDSNNVGFKIRGFNSAVVVDGVAMPGYTPNQESLMGIEQVDVVKGPAGGLFGSGQGSGAVGTLGGTIAITTKVAEKIPSTEAGVSLGSYGYKAASLDINQPMGTFFAARLAAQVSQSDSETKGVYFKKSALLPSFLWTPNTDTKVTLRIRRIENETLDYSGLPVDGTLDTSTYSLARRTFITAIGLPATENLSQGVNLNWSQTINDVWNFSLTTAKNKSQVDQRGVWLVDGLGASGCFGFGSASANNNIMCGARLWDTFTTTSISPSLTAKINTQDLKQTISMGVDYEKTNDDAYMVYSNVFGPVSMTPIDLTNPVFPVWVEPTAPSTPDQKNRFTSTVAYVQDQLDIGRLHLLMGLRYNHIKAIDTNPAWFINNVSSNSKVTSRLGAVYDLTPQVSGFAGYNEGIKVPSISLFSSPPKPEESKQVEVGLRLKKLNNITATVALFSLTRYNAVVADNLNPGFSTQTGKQQSKGIDIDFRWQATPALSVLAAVTSQTAQVTVDTNASMVGKQLFNVPKQSARLAARYEVRGGNWSGLGIGLGLAHHSRLAGNSLNTYFTPAATVWDGQVSYQTKAARFGLNVTNLFNKQYYVPSAYFGGGQVLPAAPRTLNLTASIAF